MQRAGEVGAPPRMSACAGAPAPVARVSATTADKSVEAPPMSLSALDALLKPFTVREP